MTGLIKSEIVALVFAVAALTSVGEDPKYASIAAIHAQPQMDRSRATVQATLTLNGNPSYVQDSTGGAELDGLSTQGLKIGDELLVTGNPKDEETGLTLTKSQVDLLWHGSPVPPLSVTPEDAALGKFAALLIEVNGRFIDTERRNGETWLRLEGGHQVFLARFNTAGGSSLLPQIETGSMLRLRGVCSLQPRDTQYQGGFAILLRSAEDVAVISGPPWWSLKHLIELGILLGVVAIAVHLSLVQVLKARFRAIMAERSRLGHELHDTLAQSFAGLSYQIQAAKKIAPKTHGVLTKHLDVALDMVRHSHAEAHRSIMMLRPQHLAEGADLSSAIEAAVEQSTIGCRIQTQFKILGTVERLPLMTTDTLYRIAQEAIANALRHGHPAFLEIILEYKPTTVSLSVIDDGVGFDTKTSQVRGFGLAGMRERVRAMRGDFSITSAPGKGTQVQAEIFLRRGSGMRLFSVLYKWPSIYWERLQQLVRNDRPESS